MFIFTIIITIFALVGVVLNVYKIRVCFYFWSFTNAAWVVVDIYYGVYAQAVLFFAYFVLAVWGIFAWKEKKNGKED